MKEKSKLGSPQRERG